MDTTFDLLIKNGIITTDTVAETSDIGVKNGKISEIGDLASRKTKNIIDARHLHILPGIIDSQVHFREPGNEHKENMETGSRAAVLGGVTSVFEMPNTHPSTTTVELFDDKLTRAQGRYHCDYGFFIGASEENALNLSKLETLPSCVGVKIFMGSSTGTLLIPDDNTLRKVLASGNRRAAVHAEDEARLVERMHIKNSVGGPELHPLWRDVDTAFLATQRLIKHARELNRKVHVLHVTTSNEIDFLRKARDIATVECTPQHLTLVAPECYEKLGTYAQMNPPIRDISHQRGLWEGITDGTVTAIGSDHAPHTREEKEQGYPKSPSGMPGVQTLLPLMLDHVNNGRLSLNRLVQLTSSGPAKLYNAQFKGEIKVDFDADLTLVDMRCRKSISREWLASKCDWSPFLDKTVTGWPITTILRGKIIMQDDQIVQERTGQPVLFKH